MRQKQTYTFAILLLLCFFFRANAQEEPVQGSNSITGTVLDASTGLPVEGATVMVEETNSTFTDTNGKFELKNINLNGQVTINADGYARQILPVKGRNSITIKLYEQDYQSFQKDVNLDYAVKPHQYATQSVERESFVAKNYLVPGTSADYLFKNSFSGMNVQSRSGMLANGSVLNIHGINSLNCSNRPLIIIDGMISDFLSPGKEMISGATLNTLAGINIDDIEEVTIIKDATSLYGSQGGNGVILIETIKANETATKIQASAYWGIRFAPGKLPVMNAYDYRTYLSEMLQSSGLSMDSINSLPYMIDDPDYLEYHTYHNETEWQDHIYQDGVSQNYNFKIKGGDNIALYGLSLGYTGNEGVVSGTNYERYSIRFNSDIQVSQKINVLANISWSSGIRNINDDATAQVTNPYHLSLEKAPFLYFKRISPTGEISPRYEDADILGVSNPVALLDYMLAAERNNSTIASIKVNYRPLDRLTLSDRIGITYFKLRYNTFVPHTGVADYVSDLGVIENTMGNKVESKFAIYNDFRGQYDFRPGGDHSLFALVGSRFIMNRTEEHWGEAHNSPNDEMRSIGQGVNLYNEIGGYLGDWNTLTFYAQLDYDFRKKYFVNFGFSIDGSSRFGDEASGLTLFKNKFGIFPSITTAWLISSEDFMQNIEAVSFAKIRLGYSISGNGEIGNYPATRYYVTQNLMGAMGLISGNLFNPGLQWETNPKLTAGLDLGLFNDRISIAFDYFNNHTNNLLTIVKTDFFVGYDNYLTNFGSLSISGIDLGLTARIVNREVKWDAGINLQKATTMVQEYFNDEEVFDVLDAQVMVKEGEPLGLFYGYKTLGVYKSDEEAASAGLSAEMPNSDLIPFTGGDVIFDDLDGNGIINEDDRQVIGDPAPDLMGSVFTRISWKGFSLSATVSFSYGNDIYNHLRRQIESMTDYSNQSEIALNRWKVQGQETTIPKAAYGDPMGNARFSDRWIENGSYLRLQDVTLNYRLPLSGIMKQTIDIFVTGQNLVTLSGYLGLDPEFFYGNSPLMRGIDVGMTPQTRAVFAGVKIGL